MAIHLQNVCQIMKNTNMNIVSFKRNHKTKLCSQHTVFNNKMSANIKSLIHSMLE